MSNNNPETPGKLSRSFVTGAIALAFLAVGYQSALFIHRAAALKIVSSELPVDTVYVEVPHDIMGKEDSGKFDTGRCDNRSAVRNAGKNAGTSAATRSRLRAQLSEVVTKKSCESFAFNPNTVSVTDLCRLGFSVKQAESIDNYRRKGGRFRRKEDFAKSYVVPDSVFRRLEPYIDIPLLDINAADSAVFDSLPGIGGYFASKMVDYREKLGGYSYKEQLMDIYHLDEDKFQKFSDLITVGTTPEPFRLWSLPADSLRRHPYIRNWQTARAIELYRKNNPRSRWTIAGLADAGIIDSDIASKLAKCRIAN